MSFLIFFLFQISEEDIDEAAIPMRHSVSAYTVMDKRCYQPTSFFPPSSLHHVGTVPHAANRRSDRYIFLFARSAREKERWFHKLRQVNVVLIYLILFPWFFWIFFLYLFITFLLNWKNLNQLPGKVTKFTSKTGYFLT